MKITGFCSKRDCGCCLERERRTHQLDGHEQKTTLFGKTDAGTLRKEECFGKPGGSGGAENAGSYRSNTRWLSSGWVATTLSRHPKGNPQDCSTTEGRELLSLLLQGHKAALAVRTGRSAATDGRRSAWRWAWEKGSVALKREKGNSVRKRRKEAHLTEARDT